MLSCIKSTWPPRLVTVPGLHGSEGAHWQTWLERQFARSLRVEQADWEAPDLAVWAKSLRDLLARELGHGGLRLLGWLVERLKFSHVFARPD